MVAEGAMRRRSSPPSLRLILTLLVAVLIVIHLVLEVGIEILLNQPQRIEQQQTNAARQLINKVQQTLSTELILGEWNGAEQIISIQATDPNVELLALIDHRSRVLYSTRYAYKSLPAAKAIADFEPVKYDDAIRQHRLMINTRADGKAITAYAPILLSSGIEREKPRLMGVIYLRYDLALTKRNALRTALAPVSWPGWMLSLLLSVAAVLYLVNRWISEPLRQLERTIRRVAEGESDVECGFTGSGEIAQLGMGMDRMNREINRSRLALEWANLELEAKVEVRTWHLQQEIRLREQVENRLSASERQLQTVLHSVTDGVALWDATGRMQYANPSFRHLLGMSMTDQEYQFNDTTSLLDTDGEMLDNGEFPITRTLNDHLPRLGNIIALEQPETGRRWINVNVMPITEPGTPGVSGIVSSISDITDLKQHESLLDQLANFDELTGLPNRRLLHDRMRQLVEHALRQDSIFAVCYLDLDGFKEVNDQYGHKVGDKLLIEVANRLTQCVRAGDTLARLGGDEFVLLLADIEDESECDMILTRVLQTLSNPYTLNGISESGITISIGITLFPSDNGDPDTLLRNADRAMYSAKHAGKNRYNWFNPGRESRILAQLDTVEEIKHALTDGQLVLHFQPKIACQDFAVTGVEALLRWQHPVLGLLPPIHFLPLIEDQEIALKIGEFVIQKALTQAFEWQKRGWNLPLSINLFACQLQQENFVDNLRRMQQETGKGRQIPLEIEIIENAVLEGVCDLPRIAKQCETLGVTFSLDDFGTGYCTLDHLRRIPVQTLKVDSSFIHNLLTSNTDRALVEATIGLGRAFGHKIIAEGVEQPAQLHWLRASGCDEMQGYLFAKPMDKHSLQEWIIHYRPNPDWSSLAETTDHHGIQKTL